MAQRILVVDDEKLIVKGIKFSLEQDGMLVDAAYDGEEALEMAKQNRYDLIMLDVMLPKIDGTAVCRELREFSSVPVVMVTAKGDDMDKIMGLEYGADDYVTKPFNILELKARIKAILRRAKRAAPPPASSNGTLTFRDLKIDIMSRRVFLKEKIAGAEGLGESAREREINLTAKEFDLLHFFMKNPGKVYAREKLLSEIWGTDNIGDARNVDVHVRRLREKIEANPSDPKYIFTKWGVGYYFG